MTNFYEFVHLSKIIRTKFFIEKKVTKSNFFFINIFRDLKQKMFYKFCLALLVTLASASVKKLQYHQPWVMENDHRDQPSIIYVLPDSEFNKYQTKNVNQICANIFLG